MHLVARNVVFMVSPITARLGIHSALSGAGLHKRRINQRSLSHDPSPPIQLPVESLLQLRESISQLPSKPAQCRMIRHRIGQAQSDESTETYAVSDGFFG